MFSDSKVLWEFYQLTEILDLLIVFWQSGGNSNLRSKSAIIYYLNFISFAISFFKLKIKKIQNQFFTFWQIAAITLKQTNLQLLWHCNELCLALK